MTGILIWCSVAAVLAIFTYTLGMLLDSAGRLAAPPPSGDTSFTVVYLVPALNEEKVIGATVARLAGQAALDDLILVVDDASDDGTADAVRAVGDPRVHLVRRMPPDARRGKGEALNHAVRYLRTGGALAGRDAERVIVCLVDADGRLDGGAVPAALPHFADPDVGAVQVGVRIGNRGLGVLARLQDMEFVVFTHVFQRTRGRLGAAGLGGNGQFTRLDALYELGDRPWSRSLTEDLDLGVRLVLGGRAIRYVPRPAVRQQGLTSLRRLVRQRSRWFQGHLQAWRLIPSVVARSSGRAAADLLHVLLSPLLIFIGSFMTLSMAAAVVGAALSEEARHQILQPVPLISWYALTFAPAWLFGPLYARLSGELRPATALAYGHLFVGYGLVWLLAGWWGLARAVTGRRRWLKTDRLAELQPAGGPPGPVSAASGEPGAR